MKIVKGYTVAGQLLVQGHTDLVAKVGDIVRLYLDQVSDPELPEFIRATIETPIIPLQNGTQTSYGFSYDETLLDGAITRLRAKDIVDVLVYSTQGRSAYESYLITTDDDPVLTEAEWVATPDLSDLSDVAISSPVSGQSLFRNGSNLWVNRAIVSADILPALQGAEADPSKIGSEFLAISTSTTPPRNSTYSYATIDPVGLSNAIIYTAKVPGDLGLTIKYIVSGSSIVFSNVGTAWTFTVPSGTTAATLIAAVNAEVSLPVTAMASGAVTGAIQATSSPQDRPLSLGYDGTPGTVGDKIVYTGETSYLIFECVSSFPAFWLPLGGLVIRNLLATDTITEVGAGFDVFSYYSTGPEELNVGLPTPLSLIAGQTFSICSATDVGTFSFLFSSTVLGTSTPSLLAGVTYTWVCLSERGKPIWRRI